MAQDIWNGATADWNTSADWSRGIPKRTSAVVINSGEPELLSGDASVTVASTSLGGGELYIYDPLQTLSVLGNVSIAGGATAEVDAGALTIGGNTRVSGVLNVPNASYVNEPPNNSSSVSTSGNLTITSSGVVNVGVDGRPLANTASLTIGGNLSNAGSLNIGTHVAFSGASVTVDGKISNTGTIDVSGNIPEGSLTSVGTVTSSGTLIVGTGNFDEGPATSVKLIAPTVHVTGGLLEGNGTVTGTVNNTGGTVAVLADAFPIDSFSLGAYDQSGKGVLQASIGKTSNFVSAGSVHLSGGTLLVDATSALTLNTPYTVATFTAGDLAGKFAHLQTEGSLGNHTGNGNSVNLGNGDTLKVLYNNAAGAIQVEEVATPAASASTSGGASATASQNTQAAPLAQHAASSFAPASGGATVVSPTAVAATPLLASPHHA